MVLLVVVVGGWSLKGFPGQSRSDDVRSGQGLLGFFAEQVLCDAMQETGILQCQRTQKSPQSMQGPETFGSSAGIVGWNVDS